MSSELYKIVKKLSKKEENERAAPQRGGPQRGYLRKVSKSTTTIGTPMRTK